MQIAQTGCALRARQKMTEIAVYSEYSQIGLITIVYRDVQSI